MSLDELVRTAQARLASPTPSRRRFLGSVAGAAAGGTLLAACGDESGATTTRKAAGDGSRSDPRHRPKDCGHGRLQINVCYSPYRTLRSEPAEFLPKGRTGIAVRKGPAPDAPIIYKHGNPVIMNVDGVYGRVSERDGGVERDCPAPPMRPGLGAGRGFYWGYPTAQSGTHNKGGWIAGVVDGTRYSVSEPDFPGIICGPADLDFDCRAGTKKNTKYKTGCANNARKEDPGYKCGGSTMKWGTCGKPVTMEVGIYRDPGEVDLITSLSHERYNLKYEADGTTIFWLVPGDVVARYCYKCTQRNPSERCPPETRRKDRSCCRSYSCVTVIKAAYVPRGVAGWVNSSVLRRKGTAKPEIDKALRELGGSFNGY